jgi:predicted dehydrogenase
MVRIGVLGAARVARYALIEPSRRMAGAEVVAVASRSAERARAFASDYGIARAHGSYEELIADASIDAVYVAVPPALHEAWTIRALDAKKHVLCEKPLAIDAASARAMAAAASRNERVLMEAMHLRLVPSFIEARAKIAKGELGKIQRIESVFRIPFLPMPKHDFRLHPELGGGATLDLGCYAVNAARAMIRAEPEVLSVEHKLNGPELDRWMSAEVRFRSGASGLIECGFRGLYTPRLQVSVKCERGTIAWTPSQNERSYDLQLEAFIRAINGAEHAGVALEDSIATLEVIDAMFAKAGLAPRASLKRG